MDNTRLRPSGRLTTPERQFQGARKAINGEPQPRGLRALLWPHTDSATEASRLEEAFVKVGNFKTSLYSLFIERQKMIVSVDRQLASRILARPFIIIVLTAAFIALQRLSPPHTQRGPFNAKQLTIIMMEPTTLFIMIIKPVYICNDYENDCCHDDTFAERNH